MTIGILLALFWRRGCGSPAPDRLQVKIQRAVAHQLARQVVLDAAADALGDAQRLALVGDDAFIAGRRLLRVEIAAVIPPCASAASSSKCGLPPVPASAIAASCCQRKPFGNRSASLRPIREKRTLPNSGSSSAGNSQSSLSRSHSRLSSPQVKPDAAAAWRPAPPLCRTAG